LKERLVTLGLALGALAVFYVLFLPKPQPAISVPMPLSTESGSSGYQAAWRWLNAGGIPVVALRQRYDTLNSPNAALSPRGNVLLTTWPHKLPVRPLEATQLDAWVERGNTVVIMAALDDTPLWTLADPQSVDSLGRLTRLKFEVIAEPKGAAGTRAAQDVKRSFVTTINGILEPKKSILEPRGAHPLLADVHAVQVVSDLPASRWRATPMDRAAVLQIGEIAGTADPAVWLRSQGRGQIITVGVASIFSNQLLGERDNARLLSNLIAWSIREGGAVLFDDVHQGAVSYYDAAAFFRDPRLYRTLGWILLLWLVFVLGVQGLRLRSRDWNPIDVTAFVAVSGEFLASALPAAGVGARLFENFFNRIRRRLGLAADGRPVWEWLSAQAGLSLAELAELRRLHDRIQSGRRVDLSRLQTLLSELQGKIT
jgi:hypothetical protein